MRDGKVELETHLRSGRFQAGVAKGRWRLLEIRWPLVFIEIVARDLRRFALRFECSGYPDQPPTATPWDCDAQQQLEASLWPRGGRVSQVFNSGWKGGSALYLPCDRVSIEGHANWLSEHPWLIWKPTRGLMQYIEAVYEVLQSHELDCQAA